MGQAEDLKVLARVTTQGAARRVVKRARYHRINTRRAELIDAKVSAECGRPCPLAWTEELAAEYAVLDAAVLRLVDLAYPLPDTSALRKQLDDILARLSPETPNE